MHIAGTPSANTKTMSHATLPCTIHQPPGQQRRREQRAVGVEDHVLLDADRFIDPLLLSDVVAHGAAAKHLTISSAQFLGRITPNKTVPDF